MFFPGVTPKYGVTISPYFSFEDTLSDTEKIRTYNMSACISGFSLPRLDYLKLLNERLLIFSYQILKLDPFISW